MNRRRFNREVIERQAIGLSSVILMSVFANAVAANDNSRAAPPDTYSSQHPTPNFDITLERVVGQLSTESDCKEFLSRTKPVERIDFAKAYFKWLRTGGAKNVSWDVDHPIPHYFLPYSAQIEWARRWWLGRPKVFVHPPEISTDWLREALLFSDKALSLVGQSGIVYLEGYDGLNRGLSLSRFDYFSHGEDKLRLILLNRIDSLDVFLKRSNGGNSRTSGSIGVLLHGFMVNKVLPDSPAFITGIVPGDVIVEVNDMSVAGLSVNDLILQLGGSAGTPISVVIDRQGSRHSYKMIRAILKPSD